MLYGLSCGDGAAGSSACISVQRHLTGGTGHNDPLGGPSSSQAGTCKRLCRINELKPEGADRIPRHKCKTNSTGLKTRVIGELKSGKPSFPTASDKERPIWSAFATNWSTPAGATTALHASCPRSDRPPGRSEIFPDLCLWVLSWPLLSVLLLHPRG